MVTARVDLRKLPAPQEFKEVVLLFWRLLRIIPEKTLASAKRVDRTRTRFPNSRALYFMYPGRSVDRCQVVSNRCIYAHVRHDLLGFTMPTSDDRGSMYAHGGAMPHFRILRGKTAFPHTTVAAIGHWHFTKSHGDETWSQCPYLNVRSVVCRRHRSRADEAVLNASLTG